MSGIEQQTSANAGNGSSGQQLDPQGLLGSLLGGVAGGFVGKHIGGSTGQTIGGWAGRALGALLPFDAGPSVAQPAQAPAAAQGPSQVELQNFWSVIGKIASGVQTGLNFGHQVGLFQADPTGADEQPSQLEMQGFFDVIRKVAGGLQTGLDAAHKLGIFSADPSATPTQRPQITEIEAQCFGRVINWLGKHKPPIAGAQQGAGASPLSAGPQGASAQPTQVELQSFWSVLGSIAKGVGTGLNIAHTVGLFEAGPAISPQASQQPSQVELQGFWSTLRKIAGGVQTGLNVVKQFVPLEAGPQQPRPQPNGQSVSLQEAQTLLQQALPTLQALAQAEASGQAVH